ncbi:hypothetical protein KRMM14A1259_45450 [Krasilnikovia sp. MM14-A1259]
MRVMARRFGFCKGACEQSADLGDGRRDHAGLGRWALVWPVRWWCLSVGSVFEVGGSDGADREGSGAFNYCLHIAPAVVPYTVELVYPPATR